MITSQVLFPIRTMANSLQASIVLAALEMATAGRKPRDLIHHCDKGSQPSSLAFGQRCTEPGVRPSTGSVGDAYDDAMAEACFVTLECKLLARRRFASQAEARMADFHVIAGFYNTSRRRSAIGYLSPISFERSYEPKQACTVLSNPPGCPREGATPPTGSAGTRAGIACSKMQPVPAFGLKTGNLWRSCSRR